MEKLAAACPTSPPGSPHFCSVVCSAMSSSRGTAGGASSESRHSMMGAPATSAAAASAASAARAPWSTRAFSSAAKGLTGVSPGACCVNPSTSHHQAVQDGQKGSTQVAQVSCVHRARSSAPSGNARCRKLARMVDDGLSARCAQRCCTAPTHPTCSCACRLRAGRLQGPRGVTMPIKTTWLPRLCRHWSADSKLAAAAGGGAPRTHLAVIGGKRGDDAGECAACRIDCRRRRGQLLQEYVLRPHATAASSTYSTKLAARAPHSSRGAAVLALRRWCHCTQAATC